MLLSRSTRFLELHPRKDVFFIIGDWNANIGSQEILGVTGKFGLGVQNEAGQRLTEFCHENTLVIANSLLMKVKESEKVGLKLNIQKNKFMASGLNIS